MTKKEKVAYEVGTLPCGAEYEIVKSNNAPRLVSGELARDHRILVLTGEYEGKTPDELGAEVCTEAFGAMLKHTMKYTYKEGRWRIYTNGGRKDGDGGGKQPHLHIHVTLLSDHEKLFPVVSRPGE